ncbi:MAG TPA: response regulator [Chitinophagaceae bacterium]|nr:response regulator [Chitinophagaceae bacterium]
MKEDNVTPENDKEQESKDPVKVVLADDDKDDQELFTEALNHTEVPADVTTVENGQQLLDHLKDPEEPNPDIIFLDINMPVKDGKQTLAEIKADAAFKEIPTVILSTSENPKDVEDTFNAGANLYVKKPHSVRSFILLLKKIFTLKWAGALFKPLRKNFFMSEKNISGNK